MLIDCHNGGAFLHRGREIGNDRFQVRLDNLLQLNIDGEDLARNQHSPKTWLFRIELKPIQFFFKRCHLQICPTKVYKDIQEK